VLSRRIYTQKIPSTPGKRLRPVKGFPGGHSGFRETLSANRTSSARVESQTEIVFVPCYGLRAGGKDQGNEAKLWRT
jgi:hypothetical protein